MWRQLADAHRDKIDFTSPCMRVEKAVTRYSFAAGAGALGCAGAAAGGLAGAAAGVFAPDSFGSGTGVFDSES
ncbi:MAG: hypothetical protein KGI48_07540, partial [Hyphomicrobiales bacterium]|nr:hypothetical protein [Hyphomicrobiales bacterium]